MAKENDKIISLDVRPILAGGSDPFNEIMEVVNSLNIDDTLKIINTFEPVPLIHKLEKLGFKSWVERIDNDLVHAFFKKELESDSLKKEDTENLPVDFEQKFKSFIGKMKHVDVRALEMPEPMTTILEELEQLPNDYCLFVDHKKVPQFLLPELKDRGFEILYSKKSDNHLQLLIFR